MRSSTSGFLLLALGAIGLIGFLTGNLDRWLGYLFTPPSTTTASSAVSLAPAAGAVAVASGNRRAQVAGVVPSGVEVPRIVPLLATLAVLAYVNRTAPRILPAILALLVLYAAITNVPRAQALLGGFDSSLARLIHPSAPPAARRS